MIDSTIFKSSSPKRRLRVFLCHASEDKKKVQEIYRRLQSEGLDVWFDSESLLPGQDWQSEIAKAVRSSDAVIVFLSSHSISKVGYVQKEIRFALDVADEQPENAIFLIPARLEDCQVPDRLCRWQWVNFFEKKGYSRLLEALSARASALGISMIHQGFFPFPSGWFSTKLDGYRECENTYCFFPYESLPPLDEETFQGDFKWLSSYDRKGEPGGSIYIPHDVVEYTNLLDNLVATAKKLGLSLPGDFHQFMRATELQKKIRSATSCFLNLSPEIIEYPVPDMGFLIRFLVDQQGLLSWYLYLDQKGDSCIVVSHFHFGRHISENETKDSIIKDTFFCAPTLEIFAYRYWIESEIFCKLYGKHLDFIDARWLRASGLLTRKEQDYLSHYIKK